MVFLTPFELRWVVFNFECYGLFPWDNFPWSSGVIPLSFRLTGGVIQVLVKRSANFRRAIATFSRLL